MADPGEADPAPVGSTLSPEVLAELEVAAEEDVAFYGEGHAGAEARGGEDGDDEDDRWSDWDDGTCLERRVKARG